jgi:hypothetical protein
MYRFAIVCAHYVLFNVQFAEVAETQGRGSYVQALLGHEYGVR